MRKSQRNTEQAMAELLRGSTASTTTERPSQLILPEGLHNRILSTVEQSQDGFERSVGFSCLSGVWEAGRQKIGEVDQVTIKPYRFRPHIRMHTHPKPDMEAQEVAIRTLGDRKGWSGDRTAGMVALNRQVYEGYYMLPSSPDIGVYYPKSTGVIGNMIASEGGIYLSLRNDLEGKEGTASSEWIDRHEVAREYDVNFTEALTSCLSTEDTTDFILAAAAKALSHKYTTYFGRDFESPELNRVDL